MTFQEKCYLCHILLTGQILLSDCLRFSTNWAICVSTLIANQAVASQNLKLTLFFPSSRFPTRPKSQDKNLNILRFSRGERAFEVK